MAFVQGFDYDVFISYAREDNKGPGTWVSSFCSDLEGRLKKITSQDVRLFLDLNLERNKDFDRQIKAAVEKSAVFLAVLTENYLTSDYCKDERTWFYDNLRGGALDARRVTVVLPDPIAPERKPDRLINLLGQQFYAVPPGGRYPIRLSLAPELDDVCKKAYATALNDLAWEAKEVLDGMRRGAEPLEPQTKVFVAETTDDLEDKRSDLCRYLKQAGYSIVPFREHNRSDIDTYRAEISADMAQSIAFVQLLSQYAGRRPDALPQGFPWLQHELAAKLPIYQWKPEGLTIPDDVPEEHRKLLSAASVQACGIEVFKARLVDRLKVPPAEAQPPKPGPTKPAVYISFDAPDRDLADNAATLLQREGFDVDLALDKGSSEDLRKDLAGGMSYCDGLLVIYGDTNATWVKGQYREGRKILAQRSTPAKALALLQGPPPKPDVGIRAEMWKVLQAQDGLSRTVLSPFVEQLRGP